MIDLRETSHLFDVHSIRRRALILLQKSRRNSVWVFVLSLLLSAQTVLAQSESNIDYLTEINVTSPTGIQEVNRFNNVCLEADIWDAIEARL